MVLPRFTTLIFSILLALIYLIGLVTVQIVNSKSTIETNIANILKDVGFTRLAGENVGTIIRHVLPDVLILVLAVLSIIFLSILWKKRKNLERDGIELKVKKVIPATFLKRVSPEVTEETKFETAKPSTIEIISEDTVYYREQDQDVITAPATTSNKKLTVIEEKKEELPKIKGSRMCMWELAGVFGIKPLLITTTLDQLKKKAKRKKNNIGTMPGIQKAKQEKDDEFKYITIHDFKTLLFTLVCMLTCSFYPSFVSVYYLLTTFLIFTFVGFKIKMRTFVIIS